MKISLIRSVAIASAVGLFAALSSGCAVDGGYGYGPNVDVGIGVGADYYEPYGGYYGGWGGGYRVGPVRGGDHHYDHRNDNHGPSHSYHSAPASHSMPSIPSHPRSGGSSHHH